MPYPGLLHPEPLPRQQASADPYLHRRHSDRVLAQSLWVGPAFCALPRSEQLRRPGDWWVHFPGGPCILIISLVPAAWFSRCAVRAPSQVCHLSPLGSWFQAVTLLVDVNHSRSQEDVVSIWEPAHSLVEDAISGAKTGAAPCLWLWLSHTCLSTSVWG